LPSRSLAPPRLSVEPRLITIGPLRAGEDGHGQLRLVNRGMRAVYGVLNCERTVWLSFGDGPGVREKLFCCHQQLSLPLHVHGKHLRAGPRPLEGYIVVESNA